MTPALGLTLSHPPPLRSGAMQEREEPSGGEIHRDIPNSNQV